MGIRFMVELGLLMGDELDFEEETSSSVFGLLLLLLFSLEQLEVVDTRIF